MPLTRSQQNPSSPATSTSSRSGENSQEHATTSPTNDQELDRDDNDAPVTQNSPRIPDPVVPYFRSARKSLQGLTRSQHHATYLNQCLERNTTPRGLQTRVPPAIPEPDFQFNIDWETAHTNFSRELTVLLASYYTQRTTRLQAQLDTCKAHISQACTPEINTYIDSLLNKIKQDLILELESRRRRKIIRDTGASNATN